MDVRREGSAEVYQMVPPQRAPLRLSLLGINSQCPTTHHQFINFSWTSRDNRLEIIGNPARIRHV